MGRKLIGGFIFARIRLRFANPRNLDLWISETWICKSPKLGFANPRFNVLYSRRCILYSAAIQKVASLLDSDSAYCSNNILSATASFGVRGYRYDFNFILLFYLDVR